MPPGGMLATGGMLLTGTECARNMRNRHNGGENGTGRNLPRWYALYTRARHEKRVDARLRERGFEVFLALVPQERQWHDRKKVVYWPLFPGYVFARATPADLWRALDTPGVANVIRFNGQPAPIPDEEIDNVGRFAAAIAAVGEVPEPEPLIEEGQRVRVVSGPFDGVEGVVVERRGRGRALVQVGLEAIGQGLKVEVDPSAVKVIESGKDG